MGTFARIIIPGLLLLIVAGVAALGVFIGLTWTGGAAVPEGLFASWSWPITIAFGSLVFMLSLVIGLATYCQMSVANNVMARNRELQKHLYAMQQPRIVQIPFGWQADQSPGVFSTDPQVSPQTDSRMAEERNLAG